MNNDFTTAARLQMGVNATHKPVARPPVSYGDKEPVVRQVSCKLSTRQMGSNDLTPPQMG